jgi:hypothetical protein
MPENQPVNQVHLFSIINQTCCFFIFKIDICCDSNIFQIREWCRVKRYRPMDSSIIEKVKVQLLSGKTVWIPEKINSESNRVPHQTFNSGLKVMNILPLCVIVAHYFALRNGVWCECIVDSYRHANIIVLCFEHVQSDFPLKGQMAAGVLHNLLIVNPLNKTLI